MKALKIIALILVFILLLATGWFYLLGMGVERTLFSSSYYHGLISDTDVTSSIYEQLQEEMKHMIQTDMPGDMPDEFAGVITGGFMYAFNQDWFEGELLGAVDDVLAYVKGERDELDASINLGEAKGRLAEGLKSEMDALPDDVLQTMGIAREELTMDMMELKAAEILGRIDLPDEFELAALLEEEDGSPTQLVQTIEQVKFYRGLFGYVPYIALGVFLLLCCLLAGFSGGLKWFGVAGLVSGLTFCMGMLTIRSVFVAPAYLTGLLGDEMPIDLDLNVIISAIKYTLARMFTIPLIYTGAALLILIVGIILGRAVRRRKQTVSQA